MNGKRSKLPAVLAFIAGIFVTVMCVALLNRVGILHPAGQVHERTESVTATDKTETDEIVPHIVNSIEFVDAPEEVRSETESAFVAIDDSSATTAATDSSSAPVLTSREVTLTTAASTTREVILTTAQTTKETATQTRQTTTTTRISETRSTSTTKKATTTSASTTKATTTTTATTASSAEKWATSDGMRSVVSAVASYSQGIGMIFDSTLNETNCGYYGSATTLGTGPYDSKQEYIDDLCEVIAFEKQVDGYEYVNVKYYRSGDDYISTIYFG